MIVQQPKQATVNTCRARKQKKKMRTFKGSNQKFILARKP